MKPRTVTNIGHTSHKLKRIYNVTRRKFYYKYYTTSNRDASYTGTSKKQIKAKQQAIDWFMSNDPQFIQYCKLLGLDSNTIRNKIVKHVPMTITSKQKGIHARL